MRRCVDKYPTIPRVTRVSRLIYSNFSVSRRTFCIIAYIHQLVEFLRAHDNVRLFAPVAFLFLYIHTYIQICIAPKIVRTNLRRWTDHMDSDDFLLILLSVSVFTF